MTDAVANTKELTIGDRTYTIRKFKPTEGRRIVAGYPLSALPKLGDYNHNEELMRRLMTYVSVQLPNGTWQALVTDDLINNHTGSWERLVEIEWEVLKFNCPFLTDGSMLSFTETLQGFATNFILHALESAVDLGVLKT